MLTPPITGNEDLDAYLYNLHINGLDSSTTATEVLDPVNGNVLTYAQRYLHVKYADDNIGGGISDSPTNKLYFGLNNSDSSTESTNPADYDWYLTTGFGTTKFLFYKTLGGRSIQFTISTSNPGTGWVQTSVNAIDLDIITIPTSTANPAFALFQPTSIQVPRTGSPLTPSFTGINPRLYVTSNNTQVNFVTAQTDSDAAFVNNSWRIGSSSTTGNGDIVYNNLTIGSPTDGGNYAEWPNPTAMSSSPASILVPVRYKDNNGLISQLAPALVQLIFVDKGTNGTQSAIAYLYQWSTGTPGNPAGTSTYNWLTGSHTGYGGANGWSTTVPTNPGTPLLKLWVASKGLSADASATSSTVDWTSGFTVGTTGQNGANGSQNARPTVYQWALSIPSISGTSTYTWANGSYSAPFGWSTSISSAPAPGYTLWAATVSLTDTATATSTTINWTNASIVSAGYSGTAGASARIMYARIANNPQPSSGTVTVSGDNRPSGSQAAAVWGSSFNVTWYANDPDPTSNASLYQADGVYNSVNNTTAWSTPYISSLKVGQLSAISANMGTITAGDLTIGSSPAITGNGTTTTMTGSGSHLYFDGAFVLGNSTTNISFSPNAPYNKIFLNGDIVATSNLQLNSVTNVVSVTGGVGTYFSTSTNFDLDAPAITLPSGGIITVFFTALKTEAGSGDINVELFCINNANNQLVGTISTNTLVQTMGPTGDKVTAIFTASYTVPFAGSFKIRANVRNNFANTWRAAYLNMVILGNKR